MWKSNSRIDKIYHAGYSVAMKDGTVKSLTLLCGIGILSLWLGGLAAADELFDTKAAGVHFQQGLKLYFKQQYEGAIKEFEEAIKNDSKNAKAYYFLGYSYYMLKNMPKSMETFEQAYHLDQRYSPIPQTSPSSPQEPQPASE
jgi:tetratricopeptide (TPR) repeat protein